MSGADRMTAADKRNAKKNAVAAKPVVTQTAAEIKSAEDEAQHQADLKADAEEEKKAAEAKKAAELNGAGAAMKKLQEDAQKEGEKVVALAADTKLVAEKVDQVVADVAKLATAVVEVAKEAQALVVESVQLALSHPDMCDAATFGFFDAGNKYCKECVATFSECSDACKALTLFKQIKPAAGAKPAKKAATATGASNHGIRGNYRTKGLNLGQVGRPGSKSNALSAAIYAAGKAGLLKTDVTLHDAASIKNHVRYYISEGFKVVERDGRLFDETDYINAAPAAPAV